MNRKKIAIIIGTLCAVALVMFLVFINTQKSKTAYEPERDAGPSIGLIDKGNSLYYAFTTQDFKALRYALTQYVIKQNGDPYTYKFEIKDVISPVRDGDETTIQAVLLDGDSKKVKEVTMVVKIPVNGDETSFKIPAENYSAPLYNGD